MIPFCILHSLLYFLFVFKLSLLNVESDQPLENVTVFEPDIGYDTSIFLSNASTENSSHINESAYELINITQDMLINESDIIISTELDSSASFTEDLDAWKNIYKKIPRFMVSDEDICNCDLLINVCDINCCCDRDCNEDDIKTFSECLSQNLTPDKNYCYQKDIIFRNNTIYKMKRDPESSLFCIVHDNFKEHLRYKDMPVIESHRDLKLVLKNQYKNKFSWDRGTVVETMYIPEWRHGNPIYISSTSENHKHFSLPSSCISEVCSCIQKMYYLVNFQSSCTVIINNLEDECETNQALSADYYSNFCIKSENSNSVSQSNLADLIAHTKKVNSSAGVDEDTYSDSLCLTKNSKRPQKQLSSCNNVITAINFTIETDGANGISSISSTYEYINVSYDEKVIAQHFSVNFVWHNITDVSRRSGNPGYQIGMPILAGTNSSNSDSEEPFFTTNLEGLSVLDRDSTGVCNGKRRIIQFGKNFKIGCIFKLKNKDCKIIQESIMNILLGPSRKQIFVGTFGNANASSPDDWIEVYHDPDEETSNSDGTCSSTLALQIEIVYAAVGTIANPQSKILGIRYHYKKPELIGLSCIPTCGNVVLSSSVSFFDVTLPAVPQYAKIPSIKANLPKDFFLSLCVWKRKKLYL